MSDLELPEVQQVSEQELQDFLKSYNRLVALRNQRFCILPIYGFQPEFDIYTDAMNLISIGEIESQLRKLFFGNFEGYKAAFLSSDNIGEKGFWTIHIGLGFDANGKNLNMSKYNFEL